MKKFLVLGALSLFACFNIEKSAGVTSADLMVHYFAENTDLAVYDEPVTPDDQAYKRMLDHVLKEFTKDQYKSKYPSLPLGLFRYLPREIIAVDAIDASRLTPLRDLIDSPRANVNDETIQMIFDHDISTVRGMLDTLESGNVLVCSQEQLAALERLARAREILRFGAR